MKLTPLSLLLLAGLLLGACAPAATPAPLPATVADLPTPVIVAAATIEPAPPATEPAATEAASPETASPTEAPTSPAEPPPAVEVIAEGLNLPWELVFLPDGGMLLTERPGVLTLLGSPEGKLTVEGVHHQGEGGLLGMALHPEFAANNYLYLYFTTIQNGQVINRVERYVYRDHTLSDKLLIIDNLPGARYHDGGRIAFGPDGYLYITTGDAGNPQSAQDLNSLAGKILRLRDDGSLPPDNPFGTAVYSYGHRNPQGLAWDSQAQLWATEHGPSGFESGNDEVNLIEAGKNYGWPVIRGLETRDGMVTPLVESTRSDTWAPSGMLILDDVIYFAGLRGAALYAVPTSNPSLATLETYFKNEFGRLRTVVLGPDGLFYLLTSNGDDKLIRVDPKQLGQ